MKLHRYIFVVFLVAATFLNAQDSLKESYNFEMLYKIKTTPVKSQYRTGTCWDFATTSFVETEILNKSGKELDLSEMYIVRRTYPRKAERYVRFHGKENFSEGGKAHDVITTIQQFGVVPQSVYNGNVEDPKTYSHHELYSVLKNMLDAILKQKHPTKYWKRAFSSVFNVYLGTPTKSFDYEGKTFTPKTFLKSLDFNCYDYVELSSFTHHPFYSKFVLEVPDNWSHAEYYNIPIDELINVMKYALKVGYSIAWDGDVGKEYFKRDGIAIVPVNFKFKTYPPVEKEITQELRQKEFDNFQTTDEHLMHITGLAKDQKGEFFFYTKNSWGTKRGFDGYWYMS